LNKANAQKRLAAKELDKYEYRKLSGEDKRVADHYKINNLHITGEENYNR